MRRSRKPACRTGHARREPRRGWRIAILSLLASFASAAWAADDDMRQRLDAALDGGRVHGAAAAWIAADGRLATWQFGYRDRARSLPVTAQTCFRAGSVSKLFTALLALRFEDRGRIDLAAPLPAELQPPAPRGCPAAAVTLEQLLEHTAGVAGSSHAEYATDIAGADVADAAGTVARRSLRWCPGLHYAYSNPGITLAAAALVRGAGTDFDELMTREVLRPLDLPRAGFDLAEADDCLSASFERSGARALVPWQLPMRPAGGLIATAEELARVAAMLARGGRTLEGSQFLSPAAVARMESTHTGLAAEAGLGATAYGLGNFAFTAAGRLFRGHWGRIDGFQTTLGYLPGTGRGFALIVNTAERATMQRLREALAAGVAAELPSPRPGPPATSADDIGGWYVDYSHDMALRAPWVSFLDALILRPDGSRLQVRPVWPLAAARTLPAVTPRRFRAPDLASPIAAHHVDRTGQAWWIEGASYRRVAPWRVLLPWAALVLSACGCLGLVLRAARGALRAAAGRGCTLPGPIELCFYGAAVCYLGLAAGYLHFGLLGGLDALRALGRISAVSLGLAALSVLGPGLATVAALGCLREPGDLARRLTALALLAPLPLLAVTGWLPVLSWRS